MNLMGVGVLIMSLSFSALATAGENPVGSESIEKSWAWTINWQPPVIGPSIERPKQTWIAPDHPALEVVGRTKRTEQGKLLIYWPGTAIKGRFTGTSLSVQLEDAGEVDYQVIIDGDLRQSKILDTAKGFQVYSLAENLTPGEHHFELFRRTESFRGISQLNGFLLDLDQRLLSPRPSNPLRIDFYGDSQTVGACNSCPGADQWEDLRQHNHLLSYAALTARVLQADSQMIAVSGIGLTLGYQSFVMPQIWNRAQPDPAAAIYRFDQRHPDIIVVNLGQNDWSLGVAETFPPAYSQFLEQLRSSAADAWIVCLMGVMQSGWDQSAYPSYIQEVIRQRRVKGDQRILFHNFAGQTKEHPRVKDHLKMAEELVQFLRQELSDLRARD